METGKFQENLLSFLNTRIETLQDARKEWVVKGFIDIYQNIYTISIDTKIISKIIELLLFPVIFDFARHYDLRIITAREQNYYPDITFYDSADKTYLALDIKSTYRKSENQVNGFTLGAFTGYFRDRQSTKNITFSYDTYSAHFILGVIYSRNETIFDGKTTFKIEELHDILSVISNFEFLVQEKFRIAASRPGSGNTKNIGSITDIRKLKNGLGPFAELGGEIFDDYWRFYLTRDMAPEGVVPYSDLASYYQYKQIAPKENTFHGEYE